ncbi:MAG: hypothetical protein AAF656_08940, partial [Planctomycetota bacterium]
VRGSGLMRSEDGGKTFETVHEPSSFTKKNGPTIAIDPHNADVVFRGTDDDGLFRSTEGGAPGTFEKVTVTDEAQKADGDGEETHLVIFPNGTEPVDGRSPLVYAAVMNVGLHVSQDGGDTWQLVAENETDPQDAGPAGEEVVLLQDAFNEREKNAWPAGWVKVAGWMGNAVKRVTDEDEPYITTPQRNAFAEFTLPLPDNIVEVRITAETRASDNLVMGSKPHQSSAMHFHFGTVGGGREKAFWKTSFFVQPEETDWTEKSSEIAVPKLAQTLLIRCGNDAEEGQGDFRRLKVVGITGEPRGSARLNPVKPHQLAAGHDGTIYISGGPLMKYHPDRGWADISYDVPGITQGDLRNMIIAVDPTKEGHIVSATGKTPGIISPIMRSRDAGETWEGPFFNRKKRVSNMTVTGGVPRWASYWPGAGLMGVVFDPLDPGKAYLLDAFLVWEVQDMWADELSVSGLSDGLENTVLIDLEVAAGPNDAGTELMAALADQRGFRWTESGEHPIEKIGAGDKGVHMSDMCTVVTTPADANRWYGAFNNAWTGPSHFGRSDDGGDTWRMMTNPLGEGNHGGAKMAVSSQDPDKLIYVPGLLKTAAYSHDGGETWALVNGMEGVSRARRNFNFDEPAIADPIAGDTFYVYDFVNGKFFRSTDAGVNFEHVSDLPKRTGHGGADVYPVQLIAKPGVEGDLIISIGQNGFFRTTDGGDTWTELPGFIGGRTTCVAWGAPEPGSAMPTLYVLGYRDDYEHLGIYRSTDNGGSYARISDIVLETTHVIDMVANPTEFGRVYFSSNGRGLFVGEPTTTAAQADR